MSLFKFSIQNPPTINALVLRGPKGDTGAIGPSGPNLINALTQSPFTGLLAGNGANVYSIDPLDLEVSWDNILDRPLTFTPSAHAHLKADLPTSIAYKDEFNLFTTSQTIQGSIQLDGTGGNRLKSVLGAVQARNAADSAFVNLNGTGLRNTEGSLVLQSGVAWNDGSQIVFQNGPSIIGTMQATGISLGVPATMTSTLGVVGRTRIGSSPGNSYPLEVDGYARARVSTAIANGWLSENSVAMWGTQVGASGDYEIMQYSPNVGQRRFAISVDNYVNLGDVRINASSVSRHSISIRAIPLQTSRLLRLADANDAEIAYISTSGDTFLNQLTLAPSKSLNMSSGANTFSTFMGGVGNYEGYQHFQNNGVTNFWVYSGGTVSRGTVQMMGDDVTLRAFDTAVSYLRFYGTGKSECDLAGGSNVRFITNGTVKAAIGSTGVMAVQDRVVTGTGISSRDITNAILPFSTSIAYGGNGDIALFTLSATVGSNIYLGDANYRNSSFWNSAPGIGSVPAIAGGVNNELAFYVYTGAANSRAEAGRFKTNLGLQIGGASSNLIKSSGVTTQIRNATDSAFSNLQAYELFSVYNSYASQFVGSGAGGMAFLNGAIGVGTAAWLYYTANTNSLYLRSGVHSRMHATYTSGATAATALSQFHSRVSIDDTLAIVGSLTIGGDVGLNRPSAKQLQTRCFESSLSAWQETSREEANASGPRFSVLGATPIGKQTLPAAATDAATTQTLCNAIRSLLINFGFSN